MEQEHALTEQYSIQFLERSKLAYLLSAIVGDIVNQSSYHVATQEC